MPSKYAILDECETLDELPSRLEKCRQSMYRIKDTIPYPKRTVDTHTIALKEYGRSINATQCEINNAVELGTGYADLVIILQEPSDREDTYTIEELMNSDENYTGQWIDFYLRYAFRDQRDISNTIVLDSRPFRMAKERNNEIEELRAIWDWQAYGALKRVLALMKPKVILVCQCDWSGSNLGLPKELCSSVKRVGKQVSWTMPNGHETTVVYGTHPGFAYYTEDEYYRVAIEYLMQASFLSAANALVGTKFFGDGLEQLRGIAQEAVDKNKAQPVDPYEDRLLAIRIEFLSRMDPSRAAELAPKLLSAAQATEFISNLDLNPQKVEEDDGVLTAFSNMTIGDVPKAIGSRN